jgi:hypothetical protein
MQGWAHKGRRHQWVLVSNRGDWRAEQMHRLGRHGQQGILHNMGRHLGNGRAYQGIRMTLRNRHSKDKLQQGSIMQGRAHKGRRHQ